MTSGRQSRPPGPDSKRRCRNCRLGALARRTLACGILSLFTPWTVRAATAADLAAAAVPDTLRFVGADWRAVALGRQVAGAAGWVTAADGALRLDLTITEPSDEPAPEPGLALLARQGRGWTLITGADGSGLYGAWDREWQAPPAGLAELAFQVAALAGARVAGAAPRTLTLAADPAVASAVGAGGSRAGGGFRQSLVARGRGGGGPGERVSVRASADGDRVRVRSSRRPGWLEVLPRERRTALGAVAEVFLPWWPLGQVLTFLPGSSPGTSGPDRR